MIVETERPVTIGFSPTTSFGMACIHLGTREGLPLPLSLATGHKMIFSKPIHLLPETIAPPQIGPTHAAAHMRKHKRVFSKFLLNLDGDPRNGSRHRLGANAEKRSLVIERGRVSLMPSNAAKLIKSDHYILCAGLIVGIGKSEVKRAMDRGGLLYLASIHEQVGRMNQMLEQSLPVEPDDFRRVLATMEEDTRAMCRFINDECLEAS